MKKLKPGNSISVELKESRIRNIKIESIDSDQNIYFYTEKGLAELLNFDSTISVKKKNKTLLDKGKNDYRFRASVRDLSKTT